MVKDCANSFKESAVEGFGYAIMLRGVMGGKAMFGAFLLEELCEFMASVFSAAVRTKSLDFNSMLCLCPSCKGFVSVESFVLGAKDIGDCITCGIVCESDVISAPTKAIDWGWSLEVGVYLITKTFCRRGLALFEDDFASHFGIFA